MYPIPIFSSISKPHRFLLTSYFISLMVFILILILYFSTAYSGQVTLAWDQNTEPNLAGYKIYYGTSSRNYTTHVDVGKITTYTLSGLEGGKNYYFSATAYDIEGYESDFSDEVACYISAECTYLISPTSQSFSASGGSGTVRVTTSSGCSWTAKSNVSWIFITSNKSFTGNRMVNYLVLVNRQVSPRTGTLTIAGQTFIVTQSGSGGKAKNSYDPLKTKP